MTPMSSQKRVARRKARTKIIEAANAHASQINNRSQPYNQRSIQRAVCVVRRNKLVKPAVLVSAGFNATA